MTGARRGRRRGVMKADAAVVAVAAEETGDDDVLY